MAEHEKRRVFYTADVITPDGSDTWVYGDPCEPGTGATLESGWWSPDWSRWEVYEEPEHVAPDVYDPELRDESPAEWLARVVGDRLGAVEDVSSDSSWYAADSQENYETGADLRPAAHPEGFTPEELAEAVRLLTGTRV